MSSSPRDQVIALAALVQACNLVDKLSKTGQIDNAQLRPLIDSLFEFSPASTEATYGGTDRLSEGIKILSEILAGKAGKQYGDTLRYTMGVLHLEKKLAANQKMLPIIRDRLEHISFKNEHFSDEISSITASLSGAYQDTLSTLNYRIQVSGSMQHLQNTQISDQIRTLLFAAVRSAMLWRQVGGRRWHLILGRRRLNQAIKQLC